jgi:putative lipoprotein
MNIVRLIAVLFFFSLAAGGCANQTMPRNGHTLDASINGTVTYRERIALPPDAVVVVTLEDVSCADAPAPVIAQQTIKPQGQVPITFALRYDPTALDARHQYTVRARIDDAQGKPLWTTSDFYPVSPREPHPIDILVHRVPATSSSFLFKCSGLDFVAHVQPDSARIDVANRTFELRRMPSASGAKFGNGAVTFWNKGREALFEIDGVSYRDCKTAS